MKALIETGLRTGRKAFLIAAPRKDVTEAAAQESLDELGELAETAGAQVVGRGIQRLAEPHPATFIGRGKAADFAAQAAEAGADTVVFDDELSGAQARNLEEIFPDCTVVDRTALILAIFAQRARTREGQLQVELARLQYLLPRLTRLWTHLSRQRGGLGAIGGEGESQLEADRRKTQERIERIEADLEVVRRQRATQREGRQRHAWPLASLVGYTNAGKSTLLNRLTGAGVVAADQLFATLDPTTRRLHLPSNQDVLLSDTVGFIRKLPHGLVEAFKATLEEVVNADLLLHVVDASHPLASEQVQAVDAVLAEIGAADKPVLMVLNKIDRAAGRSAAEALVGARAHGVGVSARTGEGIDTLLSHLGTMLRPVRERVVLEIPHRESRTAARVHAVGQVTRETFGPDSVWIEAWVPPHHLAEFQAYDALARAAEFPVGEVAP